MTDDIPVAPPLVAKAYYCTKCGTEVKPESPPLDDRYAFGYCQCTTGHQRKTKGYKRERVQLVADYVRDRQRGNR